MIHLSLPQIILAVLSSVYSMFILARFIRKENGQTFFKTFVGLVIWVGILFFSVFPQASYGISEVLGFGSNLNTLIFIGFVVVFMILFKLLSLLERVERNVTEIVRRDALREIEK